MNLSYTTTMLLMFLLCTVASIVLFECILLGVRSWKTKSKSCALAAAFLLIQIFGISFFIYNALTGTDLSSFFQHCLTITPIISGYLPSLFFFIYISQIKNPGWLSGKKFAIILVPYLVLTISILLMKDSITDINSIYDIPEVIGKSDVIVRIIGLALIFIYGVAILFIPEDSEHRLASKTNLVKIQAFCIIASITFIIGLGLNIVTIQLLHVPLLLAIDFIICQIECSSRRDCGRC